MGALTNGAVSSYDKGFRFSVKLESLSKFITQFENELTLLINL